MHELLKIDSKEFNLSQERISDLIEPFIPFADKYLKFIPQIEELKKIESITPEIVAKAKRLRLDIRPIRTEAEKVKDTEKKMYLQVWNAIQKSFNIIKDVVSEQEEALEKIENHFINLEKERVAKLQIERIEILKPFEVENLENLKLWEMDEIIFNNFLEWAKKSFQDKKEAKEKERQKEAKEKLFYERKLKIAPYSQFMIWELDFNLKIETSEEEFEKLLNFLIQAKKADDLEKEFQKQENDRLKKEADDAKKIADDLEKEKQEKADLIIKNQLENERLKNEQAYKDFLEKNKWLFDKIIKEDWKVVLYKKVAEFIIPNQN